MILLKRTHICRTFMDKQWIGTLIQLLVRVAYQHFCSIGLGATGSQWLNEAAVPLISAPLTAHTTRIRSQYISMRPIFSRFRTYLEHWFFSKWYSARKSTFFLIQILCLYRTQRDKLPHLSTAVWFFKQLNVDIGTHDNQQEPQMMQGMTYMAYDT